MRAMYAHEMGRIPAEPHGAADTGPTVPGPGSSRGDGGGDVVASG
jgi:hypothetical protein